MGLHQLYPPMRSIRILQSGSSNYVNIKIFNILVWTDGRATIADVDVTLLLGIDIDHIVIRLRSVRSGAYIFIEYKSHSS